MTLPDTVESDPWHFARPELADAYLNAFDLKLSSARGLFARRRMGKKRIPAKGPVAGRSLARISGRLHEPVG